jgi:hypothetical protein
MCWLIGKRVLHFRNSQSATRKGSFPSCSSSMYIYVLCFYFFVANFYKKILNSACCSTGVMWQIHYMPSVVSTDLVESKYV